MSNQATPQWHAHYEGDAPADFGFTPSNLQDFLTEAANTAGKNLAVQFHNFKITYEKLNEKAENLAASFRNLGIEKGDRIAIMLPNLPQTVIAFWGAIKAGAIVVMTNPLYMEKELTHHFNDSKPKILITLDLFWSKIEPLKEMLGVEKYVITRASEALAFPLNLLQNLKARRSHEFVKIPFNGKTVIPWKKLLNTKERYIAPSSDPAATIALLQYTGGTTGFSKGAMLTHANLTIQILQLLEVLHAKEHPMRHLFIGVMPFFHVFGLVGCLILPTVFKSPTIPVPRYVPADLLEIIRKYRPTFFCGAPAIYISLMQQKKIKDIDMTCIKFCISGSSPFPLASLKRFQEMTKAKITEGLGLTEASPVVAANPLFGLQKAGSIGTAIPGTELKIVDPEDGVTEYGNNQPGELLA